MQEPDEDLLDFKPPELNVDEFEKAEDEFG